MRLTAWFVVITLLFGASVTARAGDDDVLRVDSEWFDALKTGSADGMSTRMSEGFIGVSNVGAIFEKQAWVSHFGGDAGDSSYERLVLATRELRWNDGDMALVIGAMVYVTGARQQGRRRTTYMHLWQRVSEKWLLLASQETTHVPPAIR